MSKPTSHQANIVRITEILPHNNADKLEIVKFSGSDYQAVSQKGVFKINDLAVYIQPDSVVPVTAPFEFIWGEYVEEMQGVAPHVPEKRRRITVKKLRGVYSEGLLMPTTDFFNQTWYGTNPEYSVAVSQNLGVETPTERMYHVGDDVSDVIGITHYDADNDEGVEIPSNGPVTKKKKYPKTLKGWVNYLFYKYLYFGERHKLELDTETNSLGLPEYDVENFRNHQNAFDPDEIVYVTEKIHGSNARYIHVDGKTYAGSKSQWKAPSSNCIWRRALKANPWIEEWLIANPGEALYGEVTPTQKGYDYGSKEPQFFVFDIRRWDGTWEDKFHTFNEPLNIPPIIFHGEYKDFDPALVRDRSQALDADHISEGYVIARDFEFVGREGRTRGLHRKQLKVKSNLFLEKEGKNK